MSSASNGAAGVDGATEAFRQMLVDADEDDHARTLALLALSKRSVLVAAWPDVGEAVRTLTNADGESAMPVFTGMDVLGAAAGRFGWLGPDGNPVYREMAATAALRTALIQGVQYVVIDICADHTLEFARDEIEAMLGAARPSAANGPAPVQRVEEVVRRSSRPPKSEEAFGTARAPAPSALGDIDLPFAHRGDAAAPPARPPSTRQRPAIPDLDAPMAPSPADANGPPPAQPAVPAPTPAPAAAAPPQPTAAETTQTEGFAMADADSYSFGDAPAPAAAPAPAPAAAAPPAAAPPEPAAAAPPSLGDAPAPPGLPAVQGAPVLPSVGDAPAFGAGAAFQSAAKAPEARPGALEAAAMMTKLGAELGDDAETAAAAAEVAALLKQSAAGNEPDEDAQQAGSAAQMLGDMLKDDAAKTKGPGGKIADAGESPEDSGAADAGEAAAEDEGAIANLLDDDAFTRIGDSLRQYPEVEWACQIAAGEGLAVIGVRVDPSFMTRAGEIAGAVEKAGKAGGDPVKVEMLTDPKAMREARNEGEVFFPWRKKK